MRRQAEVSQSAETRVNLQLSGKRLDGWFNGPASLRCGEIPVPLNGARQKLDTRWSIIEAGGLRLGISIKGTAE